MCGSKTDCATCIASDNQPKRLTPQGWEILSNRTAKRPGQLYPDTIVVIKGIRVRITGLVADIKILDDSDS